MPVLRLDETRQDCLGRLRSAQLFDLLTSVQVAVFGILCFGDFRHNVDYFWWNISCFWIRHLPSQKKCICSSCHCNQGSQLWHLSGKNKQTNKEKPTQTHSISRHVINVINTRKRAWCITRSLWFWGIRIHILFLWDCENTTAKFWDHLISESITMTVRVLYYYHSFQIVS